MHIYTMKLDDLIKTASSNQPLDSADVEGTAQQLALSVGEVLDLFARTVASRYLRGEYAYGLADMAMVQLFTFAYNVTDLGLSDFAWEVFYAFDEGEYIHEGEPLEQQGEVRTRELLGRIDSLRSV
jgi:hypothetical protein